MARPRIRTKLEHEGFRVLRFDEGIHRNNIDVIPRSSGLYALFQGDVLKYIGKTNSDTNDLPKRIGAHIGEFAWNNCDWYIIRKTQINLAEQVLICYYEPKENRDFSFCY